MRTILYFSPTGNAKYIAEKLLDHLNDNDTELLPLEFTIPGELEAKDQLTIIFSIHAFNAPRTVRRFVKKIPSGLYKKISLIAVGCADAWINKASTSGVRHILEKKKYSITVDEFLPMPLTFIMSFPEQMCRDLISSAEKKIEVIASSILNEKRSENTIPFKSKLVHIIGKAEDPAAKLFGLELHAGNDCTSCGICVNNCPEKNIRFNKKNKPVFGLNCMMCMRCIYNCPEKTISPRFSKFIPIKKGYSISDYMKEAGEDR